MNTNATGMEPSTNKTVIIICMLAALAGLLFGIDTGVIAQAQDFIKSTLNLTTQQLSLVVGSMLGGACFGAVFSGFLTKKIGRKMSLFVGAILFLVGALGCAFAWNATSLILFRIIVGLAIGVASFTAPLYLSEIAPKSIRGSMISLYQLMITIGILTAFIVNSAIYKDTFQEGITVGTAADYMFSIENSWRYMLGFSVIPAILFLIGMFFLPRSPRWLVSVGRNDHAREVLHKIRSTKTEAENEYREINETVQASATKKTNGFELLAQNVNFRRSVSLGMILQIMQQLTGINVIMYFGPKILENAGFSITFASSWGTIILGLTNVLATFIAIYLVDRAGRKPILLIGFILMAISLAAVACLMNVAGAAVITFGFILLFIISFAFSAGPLIWVLCSEIQPLNGRDFGITCSTGTNWGVNMIVAYTFLQLLDGLGANVTLGLYAAFCIASIFITMFFVPETKGVSLEHIEKNLYNGVPLKNLGK